MDSVFSSIKLVFDYHHSLLLKEIIPGRLSSLASLPLNCPAWAGEDIVICICIIYICICICICVCPSQNNKDIIIHHNPSCSLLRVYGIAGRGTALIAVSGKGSFYDPPVRVRIDSG